MKFQYIDPDYNKAMRGMPNGLARRLLKRAKAFSYGRNRVVFDRGRYVVKLPRNFAGENDNDWEGSVSNGPESFNNADYVQYPRARAVVVRGVTVCVMERVTMPEDSVYGADFPNWTYSVDCGQVGYTKQGRLVAYDYGYN